MKKRKKRKSCKKKKITSGNKVVDWLFVLVIQALNKDAEAIYKVPNLRDPDKPQRKLCGYKTVYNDIFLNADKNKNADKTEIAKTLLHEALHITHESVWEPRILILESALWEDLSKEQQKMIKSYIPKHLVKKTPLGEE